MNYHLSGRGRRCHHILVYLGLNADRATLSVARYQQAILVLAQTICCALAQVGDL